MDVKITPFDFKGTVEAPASKSYMHRLLICSMLADKPTEIECNSICNDVEATIDCIKALDCKVEKENNIFNVIPSVNFCKNPVLDCKESGSTLRFLLPVATAVFENVTFKGEGRLPKRPLRSLCHSLENNGVSFKFTGKDNLPCITKGYLNGGNFEVDAGISSQFVSGILMALGKLSGSVSLVNNVVSAPYIEITIDIMSKFGVFVERMPNGYSIKKSGYISPGKIKCEGDWSNGAFWLAGGVINSKEGLTVCGLDDKSKQGDKKIVDILKQMGGDISICENNYIVKKSDLVGIEIDASDIPDLVPILSVAASYAKGKTVIKNISRLRDKESDRVLSVFEMIKSMGGNISYDENNIYINGAGLRGGQIKSFNDHRIAMSAAIGGAASENAVVISDAEAVNKSYPEFFKRLNMLKGK